MKSEIIKISKENNIDLIGFASTADMSFIVPKYELQEKLGYKTTFQTGDISDKTLTNEKYKNFKSAIVIGVSYSKREFIDKNKVYLSSCSWGIDYHIVLNEKLSYIKDYLDEKGYISKIFVDNNSLDERALAYKAGLGFFGKNNLLINEEFGSYIFLGVLLTSAVFESDEPVNKSCLDCNLCTEACPNKAINDSGILDSNKCISYLTQKREVNEEDYKFFDNCIYGCDKCISVCPYNKNNKSKNFESLGNEEIDPIVFLDYSKEEYDNIYSENSCHFRKKEILDRNIKIYLTNKLK